MHYVMHMEVDVLELFCGYLSQAFVVLVEQSCRVLHVLRTKAVVQTKLEQNVRIEAEKFILMGCGHGGR